MAIEEIEKIIAGCKAGDEVSYRKLVDIYSPRCFSYFCRISGNRAVSEDLLSELFVKLVTKMGNFRGGSFDGWIFAVAGNIFRDFLRSKQREKKLFDRQSQEIEEASDIVEYKSEDGFDELQFELNKLDADTREVLTLRYYSGLGFKEIAEMRGEPIGTTLSKVHRGIKKLKESLEMGLGKNE